jgi:hypothetical protein
MKRVVFLAVAVVVCLLRAGATEPNMSLPWSCRPRMSTLPTKWSVRLTAIAMRSRNRRTKV